MAFSIHPQLEKDCHVLGRFTLCWVLLHADAGLPWFILVPETDKSDLLMLDAAALDAAMRESRKIDRFIREQLKLKKTNFGAIGNLVPQLHLHIVGRHEDDPCWPAPVWGNLQTGTRYTSAKITEYQNGLQNACDMQIVNRALPR